MGYDKRKDDELVLKERATMGRESRRKTDRVVTLLGIDLFADTQILRFAFISAHFLAVGNPEVADSDVDFPLADLDQPDAANTTVTIMFVRLHPGEPMIGRYQFRYHHRDSVSPHDGLDLKHRFRSNRQGDPDTMIAELAAELPTVREPMILDTGHLDVAAALDAFNATPFVFLRPPTKEEVTEYEQEDARARTGRAWSMAN